MDAAMTGAMTCQGDLESNLSDHNSPILRISIPQFMVGFALGTAGYPFCLTLSASIFSKVVGGSSDPVSDHDNDSDAIMTQSRRFGSVCSPPPGAPPGWRGLS